MPAWQAELSPWVATNCKEFVSSHEFVYGHGSMRGVMDSKISATLKYADNVPRFIIPKSPRRPRNDGVLHCFRKLTIRGRLRTKAGPRIHNGCLQSKRNSQASWS